MENTVPLFVDLDGTLILDDVTTLSVRRFLLSRPWMLPAMLLWLLRGRSYCKRCIAERIVIDPATLRFHEPFLAYLRHEHGRRSIILATASDARYARAVAGHVKIFTDAIGSDGITNLKGATKLQRILAYTQGKPFAYAGDARADLVIFARAAEAIVVNASRSTERAALALPHARIFGRVPQSA